MGEIQRDINTILGTAMMAAGAINHNLGSTAADNASKINQEQEATDVASSAVKDDINTQAGNTQAAKDNLTDTVKYYQNMQRDADAVSPEMGDAVAAFAREDKINDITQAQKEFDEEDAYLKALQQKDMKIRAKQKQIEGMRKNNESIIGRVNNKKKLAKVNNDIDEIMRSPKTADQMRSDTKKLQQQAKDYNETKKLKENIAKKGSASPEEKLLLAIKEGV